MVLKACFMHCVFPFYSLEKCVTDDDIPTPMLLLSCSVFINDRLSFRNLLSQCKDLRPWNVFFFFCLFLLLFSSLWFWGPGCFWDGSLMSEAFSAHLRGETKRGGKQIKWQLSEYQKHLQKLSLLINLYCM